MEQSKYKTLAVAKQEFIEKHYWEMDKPWNERDNEDWVSPFEKDLNELIKKAQEEKHVVPVGYDDSGELELTDIVKYVHQLQNLYFALTGNELNTKNDKTSKIPTKA